LEECPGEKGHGLDYAVRVEEMRKVIKHKRDDHYPICSKSVGTSGLYCPMYVCYVVVFGQVFSA
jgi:hypothetical protein